MMMSGLRPMLEQRVGAAVDADEHRLVLADVRTQRGEVAAVVVAAHDDERVAARRTCVCSGGSVERLEGEPRLLLDVLERVGGEALELGADGGARRLHRAPRSRPRRARVPAADAARRRARSRRPSMRSDVAFVRRASMSSAPTSSTSGIPACTTRIGPPFGIAAGDRRRRVDHRDDARLDQAVGGDPVEVGVVDHRDLARLEPLDQVLGAPVDARRRPAIAIGRRRAARRGAGAISGVPAAHAAGRTAPPRLEQLGGVAARVGRVADARRACATARRRARRRRRRARAPPCALAAPARLPFHGLLHHDLRVGERRDLREVGDAEHLVPRAERLRAAVRPRSRPRRRCRRRPRRTPASAAPPRARGAAPASHARARRRTRPWPAAGPARPGLAARRNVTWSAPSSVGVARLDLDLDGGVRASPARGGARSTAAAERLGGGSAGRRSSVGGGRGRLALVGARRPSSAPARAS